jgi:hypothetical protein
MIISLDVSLKKTLHKYLAPVGSLITLNQKHMKLYGLYHKNSTEPINQMRFRSLEEAKLFFSQQKRLILEKFEPIFDVREV